MYPSYPPRPSVRPTNANIPPGYPRYPRTYSPMGAYPEYAQYPNNPYSNYGYPPPPGHLHHDPVRGPYYHVGNEMPNSYTPPAGHVLVPVETLTTLLGNLQAPTHTVMVTPGTIGIPETQQSVVTQSLPTSVQSPVVVQQPVVTQPLPTSVQQPTRIVSSPVRGATVYK